MVSSSQRTVTMETIACTVDADCGEGFVCQNGICVEVAPPVEVLLWILVPMSIGLLYTVFPWVIE